MLYFEQAPRPQQYQPTKPTGQYQPSLTSQFPYPPNQASAPSMFNPMYAPQLPSFNPGFPSQPFSQGHPSYSPGYPQQQQQFPIPQQQYPVPQQQQQFPMAPQIPMYPGFGYPSAPQQQQQQQPHQHQQQSPAPPKKVEYILSFDWSPRGPSSESSTGIVKIGNQKIADLNGDTGGDGVTHAEYTINLENGENSITFVGTGSSDSYGAVVTNVVIRRKDSSQNLLVNGNFTKPGNSGYIAADGI